MESLQENSGPKKIQLNLEDDDFNFKPLTEGLGFKDREENVLRSSVKEFSVNYN